MIRCVFFLLNILLLMYPVYSQDFDSTVYKRYLKDKDIFQSFEQSHRKNIKTPNHRISYLQWGENKGKIFVWLPGSLLSAYDFYPFAEDLVKQGFCVLSIDQCGHGLTEVPKKDLDFWDFADDLAFLLQKIEAKQSVIAGFSRGGYLATAFYQKYPEKVDALILEDGGSVSFKSMFVHMEDDKLNKFLGSIAVPEDFKKLLFDEYTSEFEIYENILSFDDSDILWQSFGFIKKKQEHWIFYNGLNEYMNMQDSLHYSQVLYSPETISLYASSMMRIDPIKIYSGLHVPMLIIEAKGENDLFYTSRGNEKLRELHPNLIRYEVFDCDSHNIHYGCPDRFKDSILSFLKGL